jgi:hypothetical protein
MVDVVRKVREERLRWYGHVIKRHVIKLVYCAKEYLIIKKLMVEMTRDRKR